VVPKVKGGTTEKRNLVACCLACNSLKSGRDWREFFASQPFYSKLREQAIAQWLAGGANLSA
jgi:hypothetical protein